MRKSKADATVKPMGASHSRKIREAWEESPREYVDSGRRVEDARRRVYTGTRKFR